MNLLKLWKQYRERQRIEYQNHMLCMLLRVHQNIENMTRPTITIQTIATQATGSSWIVV